MLIGYARVSTDQQDHALQLDAVSGAGCERVFVETASGVRQDRPELASAMSKLGRAIFWSSGASAGWPGASSTYQPSGDDAAARQRAAVPHRGGQYQQFRGPVPVQHPRGVQPDSARGRSRENARWACGRPCTRVPRWSSATARRGKGPPGSCDAFRGRDVGSRRGTTSRLHAMKVVAAPARWPFGVSAYAPLKSSGLGQVNGGADLLTSRPM
jgi:hypothetical protein